MNKEILNCEFLPCPFCGGNARMEIIWDDHGSGKRYGCPECGIYAAAAEDWDRRVPGPATAVILAKIAADVKFEEAHPEPDSPAEDDVEFSTWFTIGEARAFIAEIEATTKGGKEP